MDESEPKRAKGVEARIPVRVLGFGKEGEFWEDTYTTVVYPSGARVIFPRRVVIGESLRITNLDSYSEADFRVVGPTVWTEAEISEWGMECVEASRNIWGLEPPPPGGEPPAATLECQTCRKQDFWPLSIMECEVLDAAGLVKRACDQCGKPSYWTYPGAPRPAKLPPVEALGPLPFAPRDKSINERKAKRLPMKVPCLVKTLSGDQEVSKTEDLSKTGVGVSLILELNVGEVVDIVCPYTGGGQELFQMAEVRHRDKVRSAGKRRYGLRFAR